MSTSSRLMVLRMLALEPISRRANGSPPWLAPERSSWAFPLGPSAAAPILTFQHCRPSPGTLGTRNRPRAEFAFLGMPNYDLPIATPVR